MTRERSETDGLVSFVGVTAVLLRRARQIVLVAAAVAAITLATFLVRGTDYTASSTFLPKTGDQAASRLSGLAAQFGFPLPSSTGESVNFYAALVRSRELLKTAAAHEYEIPTEDGGIRRATLVEFFGAEGETPEERLRAAASALDERVSTSIDFEAGIVTLRTRAESGALAEAINARILELVNEFNLERRQTQASSERHFVEERVAETRAELARAENALQEFLESNRTYQTSPQLQFEYQRLQRQVDMQQGLHSTLVQSYEAARIDEVRNTPVVTVIDPPAGSARANLRLVMAIFVAGVVGLVAGMLYALMSEYVARERSRRPEQFAELREASRELRLTKRRSES